MCKTPGTSAAVFTPLVLSVIPFLAAGSLGATPTRDLNHQDRAVAGVRFLDAEFDKTVAALQRQVDLGPNNPESWYRLADSYSAKVKRDVALPAEVAKQYLASGLKAASSALALNPNYYEALLLNGVLLRQSAAYEKDPASQKKLIAEAEAFKQRASVLEARGKDR
jgi:cytochrome c-type biogenesis protein CcmH/NrfG